MPNQWKFVWPNFLNQHGKLRVVIMQNPKDCRKLSIHKFQEGIKPQNQPRNREKESNYSGS